MCKYWSSWSTGLWLDPLPGWSWSRSGLWGLINTRGFNVQGGGGKISEHNSNDDFFVLGIDMPGGGGGDFIMVPWSPVCLWAIRDFTWVDGSTWLVTCYVLVSHTVFQESALLYFCSYDTDWITATHLFFLDYQFSWEYNNSFECGFLCTIYKLLFIQFTIQSLKNIKVRVCMYDTIMNYIVSDCK